MFLILNLCFVHILFLVKFTQILKYDKQDQQGKAVFNERNTHTTQRQGAQEDPKQKQDRTQCRARTGQSLK
jgi:hypothetical protein